MTKHSSIFKSNRSQAVRIPKDMAFPDDVKRVVVRKVGKSVVLTPEDAIWDDFFAMLPADPDFQAPDDSPPADDASDFA